MKPHACVLLLGSVALLACAALADSPESSTPPPAAQPATAPAGSAAWWGTTTAVLRGQGALQGKVYKIAVPRDDLFVNSEMGEIPNEAGIQSTFYFWRCDCGKGYVIGEFVVPDYEADDVIDALRVNALMRVAGMSPILMFEKPRMMSVRFQGEGRMEDLVGQIKSALDWTGPARTATQPSP